jgi:hypothetical protein
MMPDPHSVCASIAVIGCLLARSYIPHVKNTVAMNGMANALNQTSHSQISPENWLALPNHKFAMVSAAKNATT